MSEKNLILVTGFGPYPHVRINPTAGLARAIAGICRMRGFDARALVLETSYGKGLHDLGDAIERLSPAAVLMLGLAPRSRFIRVETCARAGANPLHVDAAGHVPDRVSTLRSVLPLRTTAAASPALARLHGRGLPARLSPSAGRYLCNAAYEQALRMLGPRGAPVLFIHIPYPRSHAGTVGGKKARPPVAPLRAALCAIAADLAVLARRRAVPIGDRLPRHDP